MHCPRPIGRISTHSSGYHEERTGDSTTYLASKAGQSRQVALNLGSHRSENTGWGWCWPRLIDKVLTRHVDPGQMVRQLLTMAATVAVTSLSRSTSDGRRWLGPERRSVRDRPVAVADLRHDCYSVRYSLRRDLGTLSESLVSAGVSWNARQAACVIAEPLARS